MTPTLRAHLLTAPLEDLTAEARAVRDAAWPDLVTYSRKVFVPLTQLCRDVCHYCTFAKAPRNLAHAYMSPDEVLDVARAGAAAGCKEALFTLGDKPEARYAAAREGLAALGFETTIDYLVHIAGRVMRETGLLPHINAGVLTPHDYARLRTVSASMGLMLESASERLCRKGGPHYGSPDKAPALRLATIDAAGDAAIPFTSGLLIGIGETREERLEALEALATLHARHGHLQEVIIQNFRAKPGTKMVDAPEPSEDELLWTLAAARLILPPEVSLQAPPNLNPGRTTALLDAGLNDWGGISPITIDHVNPEAPWPQIDELSRECAANNLLLVERLTAYPRFIQSAPHWLDPQVAKSGRPLSDSHGLARDSTWSPGVADPAPVDLSRPASRPVAPNLDAILGRALAGHELSEAQATALFAARGGAAEAVIQAADEMRRATRGDTVTYVINRNINYTNICTFSCSFCAFSKTSAKGGQRDKPYDLPLEEVAQRVNEAWAKGATEVCLQGGIHPRYTGQTYLDILRAAKAAQPDMHVHAFSPLEISQGAETLGMPLSDYLAMMRDNGLGSLPGTAAEILDDDMRAILCPDKLSRQGWLDVVRAAHEVGLPTTATIMFGSVEQPVHWARHLLDIRHLQLDTGGFTEFVPLPFVHMASPIYLQRNARRGPTWREVVLMHAIGRIAYHGFIDNIQASWVKLGVAGVRQLLQAGVNDLGGTLIDENISRAAGASHGQGMDEAAFEALVAPLGRRLEQRTTVYGTGLAASSPVPS
ncbi:MAG: hypothetical protein JWP35_2912 [Caulobacter sp.]|nr:hypothetical protein [Caulobacter sp.]